jgi:hypothetical protein
LFYEERAAPEVRNLRLKPQPTYGYNKHTYLLNANEKIRVDKYEKLWKNKFGIHPKKCPDAIFSVGDNPDVRCIWSAGGRFPSFRRSMGGLFHPFSQTFITPAERLTTMGWPMYQPLAAAANVSLPTFAELDTHGSQFAGNSYHLTVAGIVILTGLSCTRLY